MSGAIDLLVVLIPVTTDQFVLLTVFAVVSFTSFYNNTSSAASLLGQ